MKHGMLPVNFLMTLILCIIMFMSGIAILVKVIDYADRMAEDLDRRIAEELEKALREQKTGTIEVGIASREVDRGKAARFVIAIRNNGPDAKDFFIEGRCALANAGDIVLCADESSCKAICGSWVMNQDLEIHLEPEAIRTDRLFLSVPRQAARADYHFFVRACENLPCAQGGVPYTSLQVLTIHVR